MSKQYKGSLTLEWYNKQKAILLRTDEESKASSDIPAPIIDWINKEDSLFYEINVDEGKGANPFWVDKTDIRVKEARPLLFKKGYIAIQKSKTGSIPGLIYDFKVEEIKVDDGKLENALIKGDNLLALNSLKNILTINQMKRRFNVFI